MIGKMEGWRCLQVKLISCRDLKAFNFFQKLSVYAVVSICSENKQHEDRRKKTLADGEGRGNPEWNHLMEFDLNPSEPVTDHLFLKFKLRCGGVVFGKRSIGEVKVPLKDLIDEFEGSVRFLSYQVRTADGKPNGVLNFSYELKGNNNKPNKKNESESKPKSLLYPSLDDVVSPVPAVSAPAFYYPMPVKPPAFAVAYGVNQPSPLPSVQQPRPLWYTTETLAYGYGSHPIVRWAH